VKEIPRAPCAINRSATSRANGRSRTLARALAWGHSNYPPAMRSRTRCASRSRAGWQSEPAAAAEYVASLPAGKCRRMRPAPSRCS
jgi:hypothetical protein